MGSDEVVSFSSSASIIASGGTCVLAFLNGIHKDNIELKDLKDTWHLTDEELNLKIVKFLKYTISTIPDESGSSWAGIGIGLFNLITFSNYDYPDHWFLIGVSEEYEKENNRKKKIILSD